MTKPIKMQFHPRKPKPQHYQVRFWSESKKKYKEFKQRVEAKGLKVQDVFNDFMEQFE